MRGLEDIGFQGLAIAYNGNDTLYRMDELFLIAGVIQ
jgi:hypothetical protein